MFTEETISFVKNLVGWDSPADASIVVDSENLESTSGRIFERFHSLVSVENVRETQSVTNPSNERLNIVLANFKSQGAYEVLNKIFDNSKDYDPELDYLKTITKYQGLITETMGRSVVVMVLNMMLHSKRINHTERTSKYSMLKIELDGFRNENGILISKGALAMLDESICNSKRIIFPKEIEIHSYDW